MIVIDASIVISAIAYEDDAGSAPRARIESSVAAAPELIDFESLSGLKRLERAGILSREQTLESVSNLMRLPIERFPHWPFLDRIWELRHNLSIYDGSYVALAEALGATLVTADKAFTQVPGIRCEVDLLTSD